MIRKYEGLKKIANKKLALQTTSLALTAVLAFGLTGCTQTVEPTVTPTQSPAIETPVATPVPEFTLEDATVVSLTMDAKEIKEMVSANGFSVKESDVISYLVYQNIFNIKETDMQDIIATYFEGEWDIHEVSSNADGFVSQIITQNLLNPIDKHMGLNFNHDELDYLMYAQVEKEYLEVRAMFEDEKIDVEKRNKAFATWLTSLEKFYNEDGAITLANNNTLDGTYYRASMSEGAEATIEYLGIEMSTWVNMVSNKLLTSQFDAILAKDGVSLSKIRKALNEVKNSANIAEELEKYLEAKKLNKEEVEELKVVLQLYSSQDLAKSIMKQCDFTDVQPAILAKGQECTQVKTK